jgi:Magnesium chelatase, subunit ChlI
MIGPPGAGKSMLAQRLPGLLPPLDAREALEISMVRSLAGELTDGAISRTRPFRNPHHSASMAALVGGGLKVRPGEVDRIIFEELCKAGSRRRRKTIISLPWCKCRARAPTASFSAAPKFQCWYSRAICLKHPCSIPQVCM